MHITSIFKVEFSNQVEHQWVYKINRGGFSVGVQGGAPPKNFLAPPLKNSKMACIL